MECGDAPTDSLPVAYLRDGALLHRPADRGGAHTLTT